MSGKWRAESRVVVISTGTAGPHPHLWLVSERTFFKQDCVCGACSLVPSYVESDVHLVVRTEDGLTGKLIKELDDF